MSPIVKGLVWTQLLAVLSGLAYFVILSYRHHPRALTIGLGIWGYCTVFFLLLHVLLALKQWWESSHNR
jgi:hypothetical protein